jgi:flavodoxin
MTKKILVMYYSLEGSTKLIAETIAKELDADSMECVPEQDIQNT